MKGYASASKADRKHAGRQSQTSSAGPNALTVSPPRYGIDFVDQELVTGVPLVVPQRSITSAKSLRPITLATTYRLTLDGREVVLDEASYRKAFERAKRKLALNFDRIESVATDYHLIHEEFINDTHGFWGTVADIASGTVLAGSRIWNRPNDSIAQGREALDNDNPPRAARSLKFAEDALRDAQHEWNTYTAAGRHLLAHELARTVQQDAGAPRRAPAAPAHDQPQTGTAAAVTRRSRRQVQGSFWDDLWGGVQAVGSAIGDAAQWVGEAVSTAASWLGERVRDVAQWVVSLVSELPARLFRLGQTLLEGFAGVVSFIPEAITALANGGAGGLADFLWERLKSGGAWTLKMLSRLFDVMGGPEALEFVTHMATRATPLRSRERAAGVAVLGENALRWDQVRIAEGGVLHAVFALNGGRAVATWHTINMPVDGDHGRANLDIVVHELTHVMQYERVGTLYMGQAIHAQMTVGYGYGGAEGLRTATAEGRHYADFNREQQAQIAQDYHAQFVAPGLFEGADHEAYAPFIAEMRAGRI